VFGAMDLNTLSELLLELSEKVKLSRYKKHKRGPKKESNRPKPEKGKPRVSTTKLLSG